MRLLQLAKNYFKTDLEKIEEVCDMWGQGCSFWTIRINTGIDETKVRKIAQKYPDKLIIEEAGKADYAKVYINGDIDK